MKLHLKSISLNNETPFEFQDNDRKIDEEQELLSLVLLVGNTIYVDREFEAYKGLVKNDEGQLIPIYQGDLDHLIKASFDPKVITSKDFIVSLFFCLLFDYYNSVFYSGLVKGNDDEDVFASPSFLFHQPFVGAYEETLFRGILQHSLTTRYGSLEKGKLYSSLIFGSMHFLNYFILKDSGYTVQDGIFQSYNAFIVSYFILGELYIKRNGDLEVNAAVHAWNNIILILYSIHESKEIPKINLVTVNF